METKRWYHSKTLILNVLVIIGSIISGVAGENWLDGETQLIALAVIDFVLRLVTKQGLS